MKVFISWSGDASRRTAEQLRDWLPNVLQSVEPFVSSEDIETGSRWSSEVAEKLDDISIGIICVDRTNLDSRWLNFEAGAISKSVATARVVPFLVGLRPSDVQGPLTQFQMTTTAESDVLRMCQTLNGVSERSLPEDRLERTFHQWWPSFHTRIKALEPTQLGLSDSEPTAVSRTETMLEEVLSLTRQLARRPVEHRDERSVGSIPALLAQELFESREEQAQERRPERGLTLRERVQQRSHVSVGKWVRHQKFGLGLIEDLEETANGAAWVVGFLDSGIRRITVSSNTLVPTEVRKDNGKYVEYDDVPF